MDSKWARLWFGATAACVAVTIYMVLSWQNHMPMVAETGVLVERFGGSPPGRALNVFAFFTV